MLRIWGQKCPEMCLFFCFPFLKCINLKNQKILLKLGMFLYKIKPQRFKFLKTDMKLLNIFLLNELACEIWNKVNLCISENFTTKHKHITLKDFHYLRRLWIIKIPLHLSALKWFSLINIYLFIYFFNLNIFFLLKVLVVSLLI